MPPRTEVRRAAALAGADHAIERLPHGYDTELVESGGNLSQGQRQLIAIARAALAAPTLLVLDEATSSVDARTELRIQQGMIAADEGTDELHHCASPVHYPGRRHGARGGRGADRGAGKPRGAGRRRRVFPPARTTRSEAAWRYSPAQSGAGARAYIIIER